MNETVWMISPNWLAWGLLSLCTSSLMVIAWRLFIATRIPITSAPTNTVASNKIGNNIKAAIWMAVVFSIISIGVVLFRSEGKESSNLISALGVLATVLVGWQIYMLIEARTIRDELSNVKMLLGKERNFSRALSWSFQAEIRKNDWFRDFTSFSHFYCMKGEALFLHLASVAGNLQEVRDCIQEMDMAITNAETYLTDPQRKKEANYENNCKAIKQSFENFDSWCNHINEQIRTIPNTILAIQQQIAELRRRRKAIFRPTPSN